MKIMIASDIHGSACWCEKLLERYKTEQAERLLLLGDLLYHGPRNDLPEGYEPRKVITMLNELADQITCVRGNCDAEVDQMVLDFPIMADYVMVEIDGISLYLTHGHIYNENKPLKGLQGLMLNGHTHIPGIIEAEGYKVLNPGSIAIPKNGSCHSYMMYEDHSFRWVDLATNEVFQQLRY